MTLSIGSMSYKSSRRLVKLESDQPLNVLSLYYATIDDIFVYFVHPVYNGVYASWILWEIFLSFLDVNESFLSYTPIYVLLYKLVTSNIREFL